MEAVVSRNTLAKVGAGVVIVLAAIVLAVRLLGGGGAVDLQANAKMVKMVCSETGETWEIERGRLVDAMLMMPSPIDVNAGMASHAAGGKPVAFPEDRGLWKKLVEQVNKERAMFSSPAP